MNTITSQFSPSAMSVKGPSGDTWYKYSVSYKDKQGKEFSFDLYAKDDSDLLERLKRIQSGNLEAYQIYGEIPANSWKAPFYKAWLYLKNLLGT